MICPLTRAHLAALIAFVLFTVSFFIDTGLAPFPLLLFIFICVAAPFFPGLGYYLPIIRRGSSDGNGVALTIDHDSDPDVTPRLLDLLDRLGVTATFLVTGADAEHRPEIIKGIIARGHAVANHSYSHSPFLMLKKRKEIIREIAASQLQFKGLGIIPLVFMPPLGITGPRLWRSLLELGLFCVVPGRRGNGLKEGAARQLLRKAAAGEIFLIRGNNQRLGDLFLREIETLIAGLRGKGLQIVPLGRLIGRETMLHSEIPNGSRPVVLFYNDLAPTYDHEQFETAASMSKRKEYDIFAERLPELVAGRGRVLEIGAGTGIFTIPIARQCREVVAIDISPKMLGLLEKKAAGEGLANIRTILCDVEKSELEGSFSVVCAFASLEYMADLPGLLRRFACHLEPGGIIYFITARRSFLRFFVQLGNAMRQGLWLKAQSRSGTREMLRSAGFERIEINTHLFKVFNFGGMLLEVFARRSATPAPPAISGTLLVIPVCGQSRALRSLLERTAALGLPLLVVDADGTEGDLAQTADLPVELLRIAPGLKKGTAILAGAALAKERGYEAILVIDADEWDDPADARLFLEAARDSRPAIVIGVARTGSAAVSGSRDLSGFLARLECGRSIPASRSGCRLYPVGFLGSRRFIAKGCGFDIETLVRGVWAGLPLLAVSVTERPPTEAKAPLFTKFKDNLSLVLLHLLLLTRSLLPWPHRRIVPRDPADNPLLLFSEPLRFFRLLCREHASAAELAAAAWVGIFIGALPIIPFGLVTIAYVNHKLHLNKLAGMAASNVCVFPFVPFLCVEVGYFFRFGRFWDEFNRQTMLHEIHYRLWEWLLGALVVGPIIGLGGALLTYLLVRHLRREVPE